MRWVCENGRGYVMFFCLCHYRPQRYNLTPDILFRILEQPKTDAYSGGFFYNFLSLYAYDATRLRKEGKTATVTAATAALNKSAKKLLDDGSDDDNDDNDDGDAEVGAINEDEGNKDEDDGKKKNNGAEVREGGG